MYAIIEYTKSGEVDYLPMKWIVDQLVLSDSNDIQQLISDRMPLDFYFPPMKASDKVTRAKHKCCNPEVNWPTYEARILATANDVPEAQTKAKKAEDTSHLDSSTEGEETVETRKDLPSRKIRKRKRLVSADEQSGEERNPSSKASSKRKRVASSSEQNDDESKSASKASSKRKRVASSSEQSDDESKSASKASSREKVKPVTAIMEKPVPPPPMIRTSPKRSTASTPSCTQQICEARTPLHALNRSGKMPTSVQSSPVPGSSTAWGSPLAGASSARGSPLCGTPKTTRTFSAHVNKNSTSASSHSASSSTNDALLGRLISIMENIKHTQSMHTAMIQVILRRMQMPDEMAASSFPENVDFPLKSMEDVRELENLLEDVSVRNSMINAVADIGGDDLDDMVKRVMKTLLGTTLSRNMNMSGQHKKGSFGSLILFEVVCAAVKRHGVTSEATKKDVENKLQKWFGNARDRGEDGRKTKKSTENDAPPSIDAPQPIEESSRESSLPSK